ncbi:MAG: hypothetical protein KatS3mg117_2699 [Geminicoccaceae bacterium]|nr:MAG: hypothetical protein KatS3mg117_2699 [Geminicoccaceae bacterium]
MSSPIWTAAAPSSEAHPYRGTVRRLVDAQHQVATLPLVDTIEEQAALERLLDATEPSLPAPCRHLHVLLATPFRRRPARHESRFRRKGDPRGVLYGAEEETTALAEIAFWRLLFFAESPATPWPDRPVQLTAFSADLASERSLDLGRPPLDRDRSLWTHPTDYEPCLELAEAAREAAIELLRYPSARDPRAGTNVAVFDCSAFASAEPLAYRTWYLVFDSGGVRAQREFPLARLAFDRKAFARDPRIAALPWDRSGAATGREPRRR